MTQRTQIAALALVGVIGCADSKKPPVTNRTVTPTPEVDKVTGQNAFLYLRLDSTRDFSPSIATVAKVADNGVAGFKDSSMARDPDVVRLLKKTMRRRRNFKPEGFALNPMDTAPAGGSSGGPGRVVPPLNEPAPPDLATLKDDFWIPAAGKIPTRDQGSRSTCAAFTGIGSIEYAMLNNDSSQKLVDFSPQRFFWMARKDCQDDGCAFTYDANGNPRDSGSWYYEAFNASKASGDVDIPLESDCPYVASKVDNVTQVPQAMSCSTGAVQVTEFQYAATGQDIVDLLHRGYAVGIATTLTKNWKTVRGVITQADAEADTGAHSGGHAYLVVGYRKLSEEEYPNEGGFCFRIKNEWGTTWGSNGYACMTWRWWMANSNNWFNKSAAVTAIRLRSDLATNPPPPSATQEDRMNPALNPATTSDPTIAPGTEAMLEDPRMVNLPDAPVSTITGWKPIGLLGPGDQVYRGEYAITGDKLSFRGVVRGQGKPTDVLELGFKDGALLFDGEEVGRLSEADETLSICSDEFDAVCGLRMDPSMNRLYLEFLYDEERDYSGTEIPAGEWRPLATGDHVVVERLIPSDPTAATGFVFLRANFDGTAMSDAVRLPLVGSTIQFQGVDVGDVSSGALCSGDLAANCGVYFENGDVEIIPNW